MIFIQLFLIVFGVWFNYTSYHKEDAIFGIVVAAIGGVWFLIDLVWSAIIGGWLN
tara:strand:- start:42744 stop:42908 length:165 start_codon:yes stop_codon:yes gene_type:complete